MLEPGHDPLHYLGEDLIVRASGSCGNAERMVRFGNELERRARAEPLDEGPKEDQAREVVARSLQEKHRNLHVQEMLAALVGWTAWRMQRKAQENETADAGQGRFRLCLGGHASAEGLSSCEERETWNETPRGNQGGADGRLSEPGLIRPPRASLHVGKLVAQRGDSVLAEAGGENGEERMCHASACSMCEHEAGARLARRLQEAGDGPAIIELDLQGFGVGRGHVSQVYRTRAASQVRGPR